MKVKDDEEVLLKIIDTAATNLEKDERFKTITDIISKLIEIKDTKFDGGEEDTTDKSVNTRRRAAPPC